MILRVHFYRMSGWLAWLIRLWTGSRFAHCSIQFDNGETLWVATRGVTLRSDAPAKPDASVAIAVTSAQHRAAYTAALAMVGHDYDWQGIAGQAVGRLTENPANWFCSEAVACALYASGYPLPHPPEWYSPERLAQQLGV